MTRSRTLLAPLLAIATLLAPVTALAAAAPPVALALRPVDQPGPYFDLELEPGRSARLQVELGNLGAGTLRVRTYAADAYTIVNGRFGARLRDEPTSGATGWIDYATNVLEVAPGRPVTRTFRVTVPPDARPGEYITSLVLENDEPIRGSGPVAVDQVVRQAVAVVVRVPGARTPGLAVGGATHSAVGGRSVIGVAVENRGNVRLKPVAELQLRDASGSLVSEASVQMDTFFAGDATRVEVPLAALLEPGRYTVEIRLEDRGQSATVVAQAIPLVIKAPSLSPDAGLVPGFAEVIQSAREGRVPILPATIILLGGLLAGLLAGRVIVRRVRERRT